MSISQPKEEEKIWFVDANDVPIGEGWRYRSQWNQPGGETRVVNGFIRRKDGRIWIPCRSKAKKTFPGALEMSVGGVCTWPEDYWQSFVRETREEVGLDAEKLPARKIGKFSPSDSGMSSHMVVWEVSAEEVPDWNRDDFEDAEWLTPEELAARLDAGAPAKGDLRILVRLCYGV